MAALSGSVRARGRRREGDFHCQGDPDCCACATGGVTPSSRGTGRAERTRGVLRREPPRPGGRRIPAAGRAAGGGGDWAARVSLISRIRRRARGSSGGPRDLRRDGLAMESELIMVQRPVSTAARSIPRRVSQDLARATVRPDPHRSGAQQLARGFRLLDATMAASRCGRPGLSASRRAHRAGNILPMPTFITPINRRHRRGVPGPESRVVRPAFVLPRRAGRRRATRRRVRRTTANIPRSSALGRSP